MSLKKDIALIVLSALISTGCEIPKTRSVTVTWREYYLADSDVYYKEFSEGYHIKKYSDMSEIYWAGGVCRAILKNDSTPPYTYYFILGKLPIISPKRSLNAGEKQFFNYLMTHNKDEYTSNETDSITMCKVSRIWQKK
jgi:hypothetical protein